MSRSRASLLWVLGLALLAALALAPRLQVSGAIEPGQPQWIERAARFAGAVRHGAWNRTFVAPHPALPVLWIAGFAELATENPSSAARGVAASRALGAAGALCVLLAALVVARILRLGGHPAPRLAALAAGLLLAFDPLLILTGGLIGLDGLFSMLILLAALLLVLHDGARSRLSLIGALATAGLATATKGAGLALVLAPPLLLVGPPGPRGRPSWQRVVALVLGIVLAAATAVALLLPEIWVAPAHMASRLLTGGANNSESLLVVMTRPSPNFLLGEVGEFRGPLFYLVNLLFRTTPLVFLGALAGLALPEYRRDRLVRQLAAIALLFLAAITVARQKEWRYLIPILAMTDVLGALGLVALADRLAERVGDRRWRALVLATIALQALWVWGGRPYYELRLNPLAGGARVASRAIQLGWTGGYRETIAFLRSESKRLGRKVTWSGGAFKWKYYGARLADRHHLVWRGRDPGDAEADCHVFFSLEDVFGRDGTDRAWAERGVVARRIERMGLEIVRVRCLPERGFLAAEDASAHAPAGRSEIERAP